MSIAYPEFPPYGYVVMVGKGTKAYEVYGTPRGNHFYSVNSAERFASAVRTRYPELNVVVLPVFPKFAAQFLSEDDEEEA